jgi:hypothetical protein
MPDSRFTFKVSKEHAQAFEEAIAKAGATPKRAVVSGQSLDPGTSELIKFVVAVGGGAGIAAIINSIAKAIADILKERKVVVKLKDRTFENMTAVEIAAVLHAEAKANGAGGVPKP